MVFINSRGEMVESKPAHNKIIGFFYGIVALFMLFFQTLLEPFTGQESNSTNNSRNRNSGPYGGTGTRRRIGGFSSMGNSPSPPPCVGSS